MLPEANEVCVARREAHEPLLVLDHRVEEVADGEVPAVRRPDERLLESPPRARECHPYLRWLTLYRRVTSVALQDQQRALNNS